MTTLMPMTLTPTQMREPHSAANIRFVKKHDSDLTIAE